MEAELVHCTRVLVLIHMCWRGGKGEEGGGKGEEGGERDYIIVYVHVYIKKTCA